MLSKTKISDILTTIFKSHKVNKPIEWNTDELTKTLYEYLQGTPYSDYTVKPFKVKYLTVNKRRFKCLHLCSTSGKYFPVTKKKLLNNKPSKRQQNIAKLRELIEPQINQFKKTYQEQRKRLLSEGKSKEAFNMSKCHLTGKLLNKGYHIDHTVPFIKLADQWLEEFTLFDRFEDIVFKPGVVKSWVWYHDNYATLAPVSPSANLAKNSQGYRSIH